MDLGAILLLVAILAVVGLFLAAPLMRGTAPRTALDSPAVSALMAERDRIVNSLQELDFGLVATGGTARFLQQNGIPATEVAKAADICLRKDLRHLAITDRGVLVGLVSDYELRFELDEDSESSETSLSEVMVKDLIPGKTIFKAIKFVGVSGIVAFKKLLGIFQGCCLGLETDDIGKVTGNLNRGIHIDQFLQVGLATRLFDCGGTLMASATTQSK